ncbi:MAG: hypothetical protein GXO83_01945 [Chlorobi bacterium]|nr:hypothetical protein [Chlorobiota bacterium]
MVFEEGYLYHIYNQGNNREDIFFSRYNYLFFLNKIRKYILPYADLLAWCLMPNHFHLLVLVKHIELSSEGFALSETLANRRSFNDSIGLMLRSYTSAVNKQLGRSGSLFRKQTKAECLNCPKGLTPSFILKNGVTQIITTPAAQQYPQICFNYIHMNPVKAGLVHRPEDWEFSSAMEYSGLRDDKLTYRNTADEYGLVYE